MAVVHKITKPVSQLLKLFARSFLIASISWLTKERTWLQSSLWDYIFYESNTYINTKNYKTSCIAICFIYSLKRKKELVLQSNSFHCRSRDTCSYKTSYQKVTMVVRFLFRIFCKHFAIQIAPSPNPHLKGFFSQTT